MECVADDILHEARRYSYPPRFVFLVGEAEKALALPNREYV